MTSAASIFKSRQAIADKMRETSKYNLRDVLPSSKILSVMKSAGIHIDIIQLKQLLRELGYPFNGPSVSFTNLITSVKTFVQGVKHVPGVTLRDSDAMSDMSRLTGIASSAQAPKADLQKPINTIRDIFYTSKRTLFNLFRAGVGMNGQQMELDGFLRLVHEVSEGGFPTEDAEAAFKGTAKMGRMTFELFEKTFRSEVPNSLEMETKVIRQVREWMFLNNLSAEQAFDTFCRVVGRHLDKRLNRVALHKAMASLEVGLSAAQIDGLFTLLVSEAMGELDVNMWLSRIYEDGDNPLQMIREVVA